MPRWWDWGKMVSNVKFPYTNGSFQGMTESLWKVHSFRKTGKLGLSRSLIDWPSLMIIIVTTVIRISDHFGRFFGNAGKIGIGAVKNLGSSGRGLTPLTVQEWPWTSSGPHLPIDRSTRLEGTTAIIGEAKGGWFRLPPSSSWQPWARQGLERAEKGTALKFTSVTDSFTVGPWPRATILLSITGRF